MKRLILIPTVASAILSGCYQFQQVSESQIGLLMPGGNVVEQVVGPGRYTDRSYWSDIFVMDVSSKIWEWSDPDLVTSDKQVIGVSVGVTVQRGRTETMARKLWAEYNAEARTDDALQVLVFNRLSRSAKDATSRFSLDEMLGTGGSEVGGRGELANHIFDVLAEELAQSGVVLVDVGVTNINPSQSYRDSLDAKAKAIAETEVTRERTRQINEQLAQEQSLTKIAIEQASRERQVQEEKAKVFNQSPEAYELEKLRIMTEAIGGQDKIYFVPEGANISLFLNPGQAVPVSPPAGD